MTDKKLLEKYNAVRQQLENCGRQVMNLRSELAGMRDRLDSMTAAQSQHDYSTDGAIQNKLNSEKARNDSQPEHWCSSRCYEHGSGCPERPFPGKGEP